MIELRVFIESTSETSKIATEAARALAHPFGNDRVHVFVIGAHLVDFDPVVHDGEEPPGYARQCPIRRFRFGQESEPCLFEYGHGGSHSYAEPF